MSKELPERQTKPNLVFSLRLNAFLTRAGPLMDSGETQKRQTTHANCARGAAHQLSRICIEGDGPDRVSSIGTPPFFNSILILSPLFFRKRCEEVIPILFACMLCRPKGSGSAPQCVNIANTNAPASMAYNASM